MGNWDSDDEQSNLELLSEPTNVLIAIDGDEAMFDYVKALGKSTFATALQSCHELMDGLLLKGPRTKMNHVAIVAVTQDSNVAISDFTDYIPDVLKKLKGLCEKSDDELKEMYRRRGPLNVPELLLNGKKTLSLCGQGSVKYIAFITNGDDPLKGDEDEKSKAVYQATTLQDFRIYVDLLTFNPEFDYDVFYKEIMNAAHSTFNYNYLIDACGLREKLLALIRTRGKQLRFYLGYEGGENNEKYFEVIEKSYIQQQKILNNVKVTTDNNMQVKAVKRDKVPLNSYSFKYSKHEEPIQLVEVERNVCLRTDAPVGLNLLCTSKKLIRPGTHVTNPRFIQDNQRLSTPFFNLFWQYCFEKERVLLCTRKYMKNGRVVLVELSPKIINNVRSFLVVGVPYRSDITETIPDLDDKKDLTEDQLEAGRELVKAASFTYDPLTLHDTVFCKKLEYVRSQLLNEPAKPVTNIVNVDVVESDLSEVLDKFKDTCLTGTKKRKKENIKSAPKKKRS